MIPASIPSPSIMCSGLPLPTGPGDSSADRFHRHPVGGGGGRVVRAGVVRDRFAHRGQPVRRAGVLRTVRGVRERAARFRVPQALHGGPDLRGER